MNYHMGDFGQVEVPKVVLEKPSEKSAESNLLKIFGYSILGMGSLIGLILFADYLQRRKYYYPDRGDADEHYLQRIKILVKKLDNDTITNKEADELNTIIHTPRGGWVGYEARDKEAYAGYVKPKLEKFFKSQGT